MHMVLMLCDFPSCDIRANGDLGFKAETLWNYCVRTTCEYAEMDATD